MNKISTATEAGIIINSAINSHLSHWRSIFNTEEVLMNYKKPFDPATLSEKGLSWQNNFNYGKGRMIVEKGVAANVIEIFKALVLLDVELEAFEKEEHNDKVYSILKNKRLRSKLSQSIAFAFGEVLENDPRFHSMLRTIEYNSFTFGYCSVLRDIYSYLGNPIPIRNIAFEDRTKPNNIGDFVIFDCLKAVDLLGIYETSLKTGETTVEHCGEITTRFGNGWIKEGLESVFIAAIHSNQELKKELDSYTAKGDTFYLPVKNGILNASSWEDVSIIINKKGRTWLCANTNNVYIARIFTKEYNKHIIETYCQITGDINLLISEFNNGDSSQAIGTEKYLMFQKDHKKIKTSDVLNVIYEFGVNEQDFIQNLRGCSKQVAEESLRYDFKKNAIEDKLLINGSLILSNQDSLSGEMAKIKITGGLVFLPEGVVFTPNQVKQDLGDHITSIQFDESDFRERISHYNPRLELSNRPNKDEVALKNQQFAFSKTSKTAFKLVDYSNLFTVILKDLITKETEEIVDQENREYFISSIMEDFSEYDIKEEDLIKVLEEIKCVRLVSANDDIEALKMAVSMAESSDSKEKLTKQILLALGFSRKDIKDFITVSGYNDEIEKAALENAAFYNTSEVIFDESQDHKNHLDIHFPKIDRMIKGIAGGEDIVRNFNYITNALSNTAKHVDALKDDFFQSSFYSQYLEVQSYFEGVAVSISGEIERLKQKNQQKGEQQQQQISQKDMAKIQLKEFETLKKIERANIQSRANAEKRMAEFKLRMEMKQKEHDESMRMKKEASELDKELHQLQASVKLTQ